MLGVASFSALAIMSYLWFLAVEVLQRGQSALAVLLEDVAFGVAIAAGVALVVWAWKEAHPKSVEDEIQEALRKSERKG